VLEAFRRGEFDQIEVIGQADEKEFFELCFKEKMLEALAEEMPTPARRKRCRAGLILAANLSLKLHLENSFMAFERVVRCGGIAGGFAAGPCVQTFRSTDQSDSAGLPGLKPQKPLYARDPV